MTRATRPHWSVIAMGGGGSDIALSWANAEAALPGNGIYSLAHSNWAALARFESTGHGHVASLIRCYRLGTGLPPGSDSATGARMAQAALPALRSVLEDVDVVFVVACLGGSTGSGGAPVVARAARASGARVVALVTTPFSFEGVYRQATAQQALSELRGVINHTAILQLQDFMCEDRADMDQDAAFAMVGDTLLAHVRQELVGLVVARETRLHLPSHEGSGQPA